MNINAQLERLSEAVEEQETPITKQEMEQMIGGIQKSKELKSYRQVTEAPVVVDVVDISDAAAKKLAQKLKPNTENPVVLADNKNNSPGFLSKILEFAKGSFVNIIKMIGGVVGWVVGTITSVISGVTNWVLGRIQKAMMFSIAKSAANMGGRFSKLGMLVKAAGAASAGLALYNVYDGISSFQSKLDSINDIAASAFTNPENIITTGDVSLPSFSSTADKPSSSTLQSDQSDSSSGEPLVQNENDQQISQTESSSEEPSSKSSDTVAESLSVTPAPPPSLDTQSTEVSQLQDNTISKNTQSADDVSLKLYQEDQTSNQLVDEPSLPLVNEETSVEPLDIVTSTSNQDEKQIQEFIELNNMFDDKSESTLNDMRQILNDTQSNIKTNDSSSSGGSSISLSSTNKPSGITPVNSSTTNNTNPVTLTNNDTTLTSIDESTQDADLYGDIKNQTTSITDTLQQKINNTTPTTSGSPSGSMNISTSVKSGGSSFNLQTPTTPGELQSPSERIDSSKPSMNASTQLNISTTNLHKTSTDLTTKIDQLNKQVSAKQSPKIVNIDNTQTSTTSDYLTDSDTIRTMARSRL